MVDKDSTTEAEATHCHNLTQYFCESPMAETSDTGIYSHKLIILAVIP